MAISGRIAAAARGGLEDLLAQKLLEERLAQQQAQQQFNNQMEERQQTFRESEAARAADQFDRTRRDRANEVGLAQMTRDRATYDEELQGRAADAIANDPNTPPAIRRLFGLKKAGINAQPSADMLMSEEERAAEEARRLRGVEQEAEIRGRVSAKYREPRASAEPRYEKIESVDDKGNPVVQYMTPEEVRAQGGVRTTPKTTAKAQGPATVNAILGQIDDLSKRINTGGAGPQSTVTGWLRRGAAAANMDNDVAEYEALIQGFTPMIARAVGHTGVLTQQDVDSVRALFPRPGDSQALAQNKLNRVRDLMAQIQPEAQGASQPPQMAPSHATASGGATQRKPIPGIPGAEAELRNGKWVRVK